MYFQLWLCNTEVSLSNKNHSSALDYLPLLTSFSLVSPEWKRKKISKAAASHGTQANPAACWANRKLIHKENKFLVTSASWPRSSSACIMCQVWSKTGKVETGRRAVWGCCFCSNLQLNQKKCTRQTLLLATRARLRDTAIMVKSKLVLHWCCCGCASRKSSDRISWSWNKLISNKKPCTVEEEAVPKWARLFKKGKDSNTE